jgi:hypothetical protein
MNDKKLGEALEDSKPLGDGTHQGRVVLNVRPEHPFYRKEHHPDSPMVEPDPEKDV